MFFLLFSESLPKNRSLGISKIILEKLKYINVFLMNLFIIIKKNMKQNRLQLAHKNRLALFTKTTYENQ